MTAWFAEQTETFNLHLCAVHIYEVVLSIGAIYTVRSDHKSRHVL